MDNSDLIEKVQGFKMYVDNRDDIIARVLKETGAWEPESTAIVKDNVKEGQTFVSVGAHFGYFALLAASLVGPTGRVYAFEPAPNNFRFLKANVETNGYPYTEIIRIYCHAVWEETGLKMWVEEGGHNTGDSRVYPVETTSVSRTASAITITLDGLFPPNTVDFVMCDAQGTDYQVVKGGNRLFTESEHIKLLTEKDQSLSQGLWDVNKFDAMVAACGLKLVKEIPPEGNTFYAK